MSGLDYVLFNTLERAMSSDVNNLESMKDRALLDMLREAFSTRTIELGLVPQDSPRDVVMGGFEVSPSGSDVTVGPGVLLQENAAVSPTPGPLDSSYRYARNAAPVAVTMPSPGADSYSLIEAQMQQVVTLAQLRDIWDPVTSTFTPAMVDKLIERRAQFFVTTQASTIPAPTAGRVPIAAVFRPNGGGAVGPEDIIDLRPLWNDLPRAGFVANGLSEGFAQLGRTAIRASSDSGGDSELVSVSAQAWGSNGREMTFVSNAPIDLNTALYDAGFTPVADTWAYLYLCSWREVSLPANYDPAAVSRGILVISSTPPSVQGNLGNGSALTLPAPFGNTVPTSRAVCVGALLRSNANDGWIPQWGVNGRFRMGANLSPNTVVIGTPTGADDIDVTSLVPRCAREGRFRFLVIGGAITAIYLRSAGGGTYTYDGVACSATAGGVELAAPLFGSPVEFQVDTAGTTPSSIVVQLVGWSM